MIDMTEVSRALIVWTGWGESLSPRRDDAALVEVYGEPMGREILGRVQALEAEFYESDAWLTALDLPGMGRTAAAEFRARHPDIAQDAIDALTWCYTFDYR